METLEILQSKRLQVYLCGDNNINLLKVYKKDQYNIFFENLVSAGYLPKISLLTRTTLDYCNGILFNLPKNKIERLQRIQNQAARMLKRIPRHNHITPVLKDLHWLRINERIEFKILILTHRAFYETGPRYLSELIKKHNSSNRTRRANDHCLLSIPPISKMCANSYFERSFSYAAPFLWNRLDMSIRMLDFDHFKSRIKTELYLRYFEA